MSAEPIAVELTADEAASMACQMWGPRAFAFEKRRYTGREKAGPDNVVRPDGEVYGYTVGYRRTGKRGATLYTTKGDSAVSFADALLVSCEAMTESQRDAWVRRCGAYRAAQLRAKLRRIRDGSE